MPRVRANDYDDKKRVILRKAAALIARRGFDVATMLDVAKACGASKSRIYYYFPTKEDLLYEIVREHIAEQARALRGIVEEDLPAARRFEHFVDCFMRSAARSRNEHLILMNDVKFLPRAQLDEVRRMEIDMTGLLQGLLHELNPGAMREASMRKPYSLLLFGMMIWTFTWYRPSGEVGPAELGRRIAALILNGFEGLPDPGMPATT